MSPHQELRSVGPHGIPMELMGSLGGLWSPEESDTLQNAGGQRISPATLTTYSGGKYYVDVKSHLIRNTPQNAMNPRGVLEGAVENLLIRSEQFDNTSWGRTATSVTADQIAAPDGATTGDELIEDSATNQHIIFDQISNAEAATVAASFFLKKNTRTYAVIRVNVGGENYWLNVNLSNGTIEASGTEGTGVLTDAYAVAHSDGWYRVTLVGSITGQSNYFVVVKLAEDENDTSQNTYEGDGSSSIYLWGAQAEVSAFSSSYIPTISAPITRAKDDFDFSTTGILSAGEGSVAFWATTQYDGADVGSDAYVFDFTDATPDGVLGFFDQSNLGKFTAIVYSGGSAVATLVAAAAPVRNTRTHYCVTWQKDSHALYVNDVRDATQGATAAAPAAIDTNLFLGQTRGNANQGYIALEQFATFNRPITNNEEVRLYRSTLPYIDGRALPW